MESTQFLPHANWNDKKGDWLSMVTSYSYDVKHLFRKDNYLSIQGFRIVELLSPGGKLLSSLLKTNWQIQMDIKLLPEKVQMKLSNAKEYAHVAATHHLLYENMLKMQPRNKVELDIPSLCK